MLPIKQFILRKIIGLFVVVLLLNLFCQNLVESFIINKNPCTISNFSNKKAIFKHNNFPNTDILDASNTIQVINNTHQSKEAPNNINSDIAQKESNTSHNILALLCGHSLQTDILTKLSDYISQNDSSIKRILYITSSLQKMYDTIGLFSNKYQNKMNIIDFDIISLNNDAPITFTFDTCLNQFLFSFLYGQSNMINPAVLTYNGTVVTDSNREEFMEFFKSLIFSFFMTNDEIKKSKFNKNPAISFNKESLTPANKWIDDNYVDADYIVDHFKNIKNKESLVFLSDFSFNYDVTKNTLHYSLFEYPLIHIKQNCAVIGASKQLYSTQNVINWLESLFGDFKTVSLSKTPRFKLLTSHGHTDIFTDEPVTYASKFNKLNPDDTKELYKYFTKKSNLAKLTNINPNIKTVLANVIIDSLKHRGIYSYNKLIRSKTQVRDILKRHIRELRRDFYFNSLPDKMVYLINSMIDLPNNKTLANLVEALNLKPVIRARQSVSIDRLISYVKEQNMYPTVLYFFDQDLRIVEQELYNYVLNKNRSNTQHGSSADSNSEKDTVFEVTPDLIQSFKIYSTNSRPNKIQERLFENGFYMYNLNLRYSYKNFANEFMDKLKVVVSNTFVPGAKHYIFVGSSFETKTSSVPNILLYSSAQGADLVTFTFDMDHLFHNIRALVSPIYFNFSNLVFNNKYFGFLHDKLRERLFKTYLKYCKKEYLKQSPDPLNLIMERDQLENKLSRSKIDTHLLLKLNRRINSLERRKTIIRKSLIFRFFFRSKVISMISHVVNLIGSTVLAVDDRHYKLLYIGKHPTKCLNFKNEEDLSKFTSQIKPKEEYVMLQDLENKNYLMAELSFLKDIVKLPGQGESEVSPLDVSAMYFNKITPENDIKELPDPKNLTINYICLNEEKHIENPKLSSMIPKATHRKMNKVLDEYEKRVREKQALLNNAMPTKSIPDEVNDKSEELENQCENYRKLEENLKKTSLEKILVEHRFKNSFWGR